MVARVGIEPTAHALSRHRSTDELTSYNFGPLCRDRTDPSKARNLCAVHQTGVKSLVEQTGLSPVSVWTNITRL